MCPSSAAIKFHDNWLGRYINRIFPNHLGPASSKNALANAYLFQAHSDLLTWALDLILLLAKVDGVV